MEVDEKPEEEYSDIGGLDKQIQELVEAVVLPMTHADKFKAIGIKPPKGILLHGPPGTGKTLLARACAKQTDAIFLKLAGPQLVQMFIGDGAKLVRDAFELAKEKSKDRGGAIIFIDELDAIGTKRYGGEKSGDREVQRTMLELLNQLDGFQANDKIKVIAATNRPDVLDPALLRSGRLDRKIELPHPNERARARIMQIHSRKMNVCKEGTQAANFEELARSTDDFNGAQLKAVCVEAGMLALRREATELCHEDFMEGIAVVQAKKKASLQYCTFCPSCCPVLCVPPLPHRSFRLCFCAFDFFFLLCSAKTGLAHAFIHFSPCRYERRLTRRRRARSDVNCVAPRCLKYKIGSPNGRVDSERGKRGCEERRARRDATKEISPKAALSSREEGIILILLLYRLACNYFAYIARRLGGRDKKISEAWRFSKRGLLSRDAVYACKCSSLSLSATLSCSCHRAPTTFFARRAAVSPAPCIRAGRTAAAT